MLTTCRHGTNWEKLCDLHENVENCLRDCHLDNEQYDVWDYTDLLMNSTFCMVPRGRRLGSFRFIEVMQQGCIPIVMSNGWVLPFQEVIDYSRAGINWDERLLIELKDRLMNMNNERVMKMRSQAAFLYTQYFRLENTVFSQF